jgi:hypothetical protein
LASLWHHFGARWLPLNVFLATKQSELAWAASINVLLRRDAQKGLLRRDAQKAM